MACAESNVAVDNLLEGLTDLGIKAVRIGKPVKVRDSLRNSTLDAMVDEHPAQEEIALIKQANDKLRKNLDKLKGREKGLTHKEINNNFREMRHIETQLLNSILDGAEVICCTTIGAGHHVLGDLSLIHI